jgi:hypothetical protein
VYVSVCVCTVFLTKKKLHISQVILSEDFVLPSSSAPTVLKNSKICFFEF